MTTSKLPTVICPKCQQTQVAKKDGSPRPHVGYINVCGITMRKLH